MAKVAVVYHSQYGHTEVQAKAVLAGISSVDGVEGVLMTAEEATANLDSLDDAAGIIFGCPTYMGSLSAGMKTFIEASAKKWFTLAWKDKVAGGFTNSSSFSGDKVNTLQDLWHNAMQHGMIWVSLGLHPCSNRPDDMNAITGPGPEAHNRVGGFGGALASSFQVAPPDAPPVGDRETAEIYGRRVAEVALKLHG